MTYTAKTDAQGQFAVSSVFQGLYALRALVRRQEDGPILAAGVAEVDVRTSDTTDLVVTLAAPARLSGRFMFNGAEEPDPARTQIAMLPDGPHGHLVASLVDAGTWHADGQFEVDGIIGPQRLTLRSSGSLFIERATLPDGTELAGAPYAFAAGRTYANARVWLSDRVATVSGLLPSWWDPHEGVAIIAFPEEASLRTAGSKLVRLATISMETKRFTFAGLPAGQTYLVAAFSGGDTPDWHSEEMFQLLTPAATRVLATDAQLYDAVLGPPVRR